MESDGQGQLGQRSAVMSGVAARLEVGKPQKQWLDTAFQEERRVALTCTFVFLPRKGLTQLS